MCSPCRAVIPASPLGASPRPAHPGSSTMPIRSSTSRRRGSSSSKSKSTLGTLEVEVETALAMFEDGSALMPDYYIVLEPEGAPDTWRHWWCGALGHRAPQRVLASPAPASPQGCRAAAHAEPSAVVATVARPGVVAAPPSVRDPRPGGAARLRSGSERSAALTQPANRACRSGSTRYRESDRAHDRVFGAEQDAADEERGEQHRRDHAPPRSLQAGHATLQPRGSAPRCVPPRSASRGHRSAAEDARRCLRPRPPPGRRPARRCRPPRRIN